jgi:hypothetical protein
MPYFLYQFIKISTFEEMSDFMSIFLGKFKLLFDKKKQI